MFTPNKMYLWYQKQVVDARAGPGMKSMTKFKSKHKKMMENNNNGDKTTAKKKQFDREYSPTLSDPQDVEMADVDFLMESGPSEDSSRTASPGNSDCEDGVTVNNSRRHKGVAKRRENLPEISEFVDLEFWKR